jgi:RNA polymerase sigma-70 factor (ECF subfamily)
MTDDRRLVEAYVSRRDEASFLALYRAHTPALFRMAWRLGGLAPGDMDDVVQETWLRAARALDRFQFQSTLRTWLTSILINCAQEARRRLARHGMADTSARNSMDLPDLPGARATPHLRVDLDRAVAALPPGMREVFQLHDVEGFTHGEVAAALDITEGTSKSQLFAARRKLRALLASGPAPLPFRKADHE